MRCPRWPSFLLRWSQAPALVPHLLPLCVHMRLLPVPFRSPLLRLPRPRRSPFRRLSRPLPTLLRAQPPLSPLRCRFVVCLSSSCAPLCCVVLALVVSPPLPRPSCHVLGPICVGRRCSGLGPSQCQGPRSARALPLVPRTTSTPPPRGGRVSAPWCAASHAPPWVLSLRSRWAPTRRRDRLCVGPVSIPDVQ